MPEAMDSQQSPQHEYLSTIKLSRPYFRRAELKDLHGLSGLSGANLDSLRLQALHHSHAIANHFNFPIKTIAATMYLFQKTVLFNRLTSPHDLIVACVLVASKIEDTPKKISQLLQCSYTIRNKGTLPDDTPRRKQVLGLERQILETVGFDFRLKTAHAYIAPICKCEGDKIPRGVAKTAWLIATDALATDAILSFPAHFIAFAAIVLAAKVEKVNIFPIEPQKYVTRRSAISEILVELLSFYDRIESKDAFLSKRWFDKPTMREWNSKFSQELTNADTNSYSEDPSNAMNELQLREPHAIRNATVRYVLDWELDHVAGETVS